MTRRDFLLGAAAFGLGGWRLFAAPSGWKHGGKPNLVFGVLADTHFRMDSEWRRGIKTDRFLVAALEYFRSQNVDAVVHCGDMADRGLVEEMRLHADAWRRVFPENRTPDGHVVEKLFVTGNHDIDAWHKGFDFTRFVPNKAEWPEKVLNTDIAGHWRRIWGEEYEPVWHKTVKGYHFFGMNWIPNDHGQGEAELSRCIDETMGSLAHEEKRNPAPFFFISHNITHGRFNRAIKKHPNAFGLWGHWHFSAANWGVIRMLNETTPGVQCPACPAWWRSDGKWMGGGEDAIVKAPLEGKLQGGKWEQGLVVRVYDDMLTIERREFSEGGSLGADWVMPFSECKVESVKCKVGGTGKHPFSKDELKKVIGEPQFKRGAALEICNCENVKLCNYGNMETKEIPQFHNSIIPQSHNLTIKIPLADGNPDSRVYAYEVVVVGDEGTTKLHKAVYAAGCNMGIGHEPNGGVTTLDIPKPELPPGKTLTFAVRPLTSLGTAGKPIAKEVAI
ncbi:MAG: metallophosphoesterase [Kiritimatiellae bacterium]|nr:metallophosphoesterase [Kiritimatiellia bacterium]